MVMDKRGQARFIGKRCVVIFYRRFNGRPPERTVASSSYSPII